MSEIDNTLDMLTEAVVKRRIKGQTIEQAAKDLGIPTVDAVAAWKNYVATRSVMDRAEWFVLYEERLEDFLHRLNERLDDLGTGARPEDFKNVLDLYDRIEKLQGLNTERKSAAEDELRRITVAQTQVILSAVFAMLAELRSGIEAAFANGKTIKGIRAEVAEVLENRALPAAQAALASAGSQE